jgi:hypothetical protein
MQRDDAWFGQAPSHSKLQKNREIGEHLLWIAKQFSE